MGRHAGWGVQQAQSWNKWEMVAFNTLEQMEKSQQLNLNMTVSGCSMPGSVPGAIHGSEDE